MNSRTTNPAKVDQGKTVEALSSTRWDVAVVGAGYAGYAAATAAAAAGLKTILIDPECDLLWESAHARCPEAGKTPDSMRTFMYAIGCATGIAEDWIDPGSAEWVANELLAATAVTRMYFATPVAADIAGNGLLRSVTFALRSRLAAISAEKWIDATEHGLLARLCGLAEEPVEPSRHVLRFFLQRTRWPIERPFTIDVGMRGVKVVFESSGWSSEKILRIECPRSMHGGEAGIVEPVFKALRRRLGKTCADAFVSHWSYRAYPLYPRRRASAKSPCPNLAIAVPSLSSAPSATLGDRYALGEGAFTALENAPRCTLPPPSRPLDPKPLFTIETDVCVAGLGTGGLFAAVAASAGGAGTLALEARSMVGGIPSIGGIPSYYHGCHGGMQDEFDAEVKRLQPLFATQQQVGRGYHGLARLVATWMALGKAGVSTLLESRTIPSSAEVKDGRIVSILAATPKGIVRIAAKNWIDSTGDAFLSASAGVPLSVGREGDGSMNPFSQIWGCFGFGANQELTLFIDNRDCGHVDPSDSLDMTTARIEATRKLVADSCVRTSNTFNRTTGMAPAIGIRQGPLAATRYRLTLDDLVEHRAFDDVIGFTAGHVDGHACDFFAEGRDLAFYNWCCGLWQMPTGCEIPYRAILAEGIDNLFVACRAAGCTSETTYAFRMQRDIQRIGEAAGIAAALSTRLGVASGDVPLERLQKALRASGALEQWTPGPGIFGEVTPRAYEGVDLVASASKDDGVRCLVSAIGGEHGGLALWLLYRMGLERVADSVWPLVGQGSEKSGDAALLLGALGDKRVEPVLAAMAADREDGPHPNPFGKAQHSLASVWALGFCGGRASLRTLSSIACDTTRGSMVRMTALWSAGDIAIRLAGKCASERDAILRMLDGTCDLTDALPDGVGPKRARRPWQRAFVAERLRKAGMADSR